MEKIVIVGSGPAGHTAALYAARANLSPLMIEGFSAGGSPGGQLVTTNEVENYPGFPEGITGPELMRRMREQSAKYGTRFVTEDVVSTDLSRRPFKVKASEEFDCQALIIATGAVAKRMQLPNEPKLWNRGISACAVCDGALPLFRNKPLVVVGGGDSAVEEATHLTHFGSRVYLVHRRDKLRASAIMQKRAAAHSKIEILWNTQVEDVLGESKIEGVRIRDTLTGKTRELPCGGLFYAIGHAPNTAFLNGQLKLDATGYVVTTPGSTQTSLPGVFACGDVQDKKYRQAVTAAGSGCMAALEAQKFLETGEL